MFSKLFFITLLDYTLCLIFRSKKQKEKQKKARHVRDGEAQTTGIYHHHY